MEGGAAANGRLQESAGTLAREGPGVCGAAVTHRSSAYPVGQPVEAVELGGDTIDNRKDMGELSSDTIDNVRALEYGRYTIDNEDVAVERGCCTIDNVKDTVEPGGVTNDNAKATSERGWATIDNVKGKLEPGGVTGGARAAGAAELVEGGAAANELLQVRARSLACEGPGARGADATHRSSAYPVGQPDTIDNVKDTVELDSDTIDNREATVERGCDTIGNFKDTVEPGGVTIYNVKGTVSAAASPSTTQRTRWSDMVDDGATIDNVRSTEEPDGGTIADNWSADAARGARAARAAAVSVEGGAAANARPMALARPRACKGPVGRESAAPHRSSAYPVDRPETAARTRGGLREARPQEAPESARGAAVAATADDESECESESDAEELRAAINNLTCRIGWGPIKIDARRALRGTGWQGFASCTLIGELVTGAAAKTKEEALNIVLTRAANWVATEAQRGLARHGL